MKRILFLLFIAFMTLSGTAQDNVDYTEDDLRFFYTTLQGDYVSQVNDSTTMTLHLTPIWEQQDNLRWLYLEVTSNEGKDLVEQKVLEVVPVSSITFKVYVHGIRHPETFAGKWGNPNFFDGYNSSILKGKKRFMFFKTKDYEYQTNWNSRKSLKCFPRKDRIHFKFVKEDERLYIKRIPAKTTRIFGFTFFKDQTD